MKMFAPNVNWPWLAALLLLAQGCVPKEPVEPEPSGISVGVQFAFRSGGSSFNPQAMHQDGAGHAIRFGTFRFIMSGIGLEDSSGQVLASFPGSAILANGMQTQGVQSIGRIAAGMPARMGFLLGLDSAMNHANPLTLPYPFSAPGLHWDWNPAAGFKFLELEGHVDGNGDGDFMDPQDQVFTYHCATDSLLRADTLVVLPAQVPGGLVIAVPVDAGQLLQGIDLLAAPTAMGAAAGCALAMENLVLAVGAP